MVTLRSAPSMAYLEWRIRIFGAGAILAMVGIFTAQGWLIDVAIGVLLIGFAMRFLKGRRGPVSDGDVSEENDLPG